ncbi:MAG: bifunctional diaminohydroxyphosphoribosylaminopyrimidine deaminase/5-amino-6-(5-phosphoribosylamino)uracil reductase RibD [Abditibacteriota bacterium]|nr:bifunctional diaminohydroxyphosphoribosylaminopyrimidine deaminase/5-amino-6-(5-phosphoribosylamino)uracil reductase RibD [Abditibacteriota bacterium]
MNTEYMRLAIRLASKYDPSPNPRVGAVIVRDGAILGRGAHRRAGAAHAEINALAGCPDARGADVYVTLEPCCHYGKTPPCADALIKAGVRRVFIGMQDPDSKVSGGGIETLRRAGIETVCGVLEEECRALNREYITHRTLHRPFVILKQAMTLDGKTAAASGDSKWISSERSRRLVHRLRSKCDGVLVGGNTFRRDDPSLSARTGGARVKQPCRIVLTSAIPETREHNIFRAPGGPVIFARPGDANKTEDREGYCLITYREGRLRELLAILADIGIMSLLVEGGARTAGSFVKEGLWDEGLFFYAPKLLNDSAAVGQGGGDTAVLIEDAHSVTVKEVRRIGEDILVKVAPCLQD